MKLIDAVNKWTEIKPNYFITAGDHKFSCTCNDCACFLLGDVDDFINDPEDPIDPAIVAEWEAFKQTDVNVDGQWLNTAELTAAFNRITGAIF